MNIAWWHKLSAPTTPERRLRVPSAAPGGRVLCNTLSLPMLETGSSQIVTEARRSRRLWTPKPGAGVQNSLICAAQLVIAEAALAAPNGGAARASGPPSFSVHFDSNDPARPHKYALRRAGRMHGSAATGTGLIRRRSTRSQV